MQPIEGQPLRQIDGLAANPLADTGVAKLLGSLGRGEVEPGEIAADGGAHPLLERVMDLPADGGRCSALPIGGVTSVDQPNGHHGANQRSAGGAGASDATAESGRQSR